MTQHTSLVANWFVTNEHRTKAQIKYEIKQLESCLHKHFEPHLHAELNADEVDSLCETLAHRYMDYLKIINITTELDWHHLKKSHKIKTREACYAYISNLKKKLSQTLGLEEEQYIIAELARSYYQLRSNPQHEIHATHELHVKEFKQLFKKDNLGAWLKAMVDFWNHSTTPETDIPLLFRSFDLEQQQLAINFFMEPEVVDLVNAVFFFKLYPDKLFTELIHPEKLVSVRMRLSVLHHYVEILQTQLNNSALQHGLKPSVDYFFHGNELPQGIMIDVKEEFREMIQTVLKHLKITFTSEDESQITLDRLHDFARAYKFWFNPNRLIDAVMVLQQRLVKKDIPENNKLVFFQQEMQRLYHQLTTTECLDLYGYFANNDSRYLLYTLLTLIKGNPVDWMPSLTLKETTAIKEVFSAIQCVMEALREELKDRHINTEPYIYDLEKQVIQIRRRNRDAVFRLIAIYGHETITLSEAIEKLFRDFEKNEG